MAAGGRSPAARRVLHRMRRRRGAWDFSDYLELRRLRDGGERDDALDAALAHLERALPVPFADAIPNLATLADAPAPPPRGLAREHLRVALAMREEFAAHGATRAGMTGIDLPERPGLPDWLDLVEAERRHALAARKALRELDAKTWAVFTGERRMPTAPPAPPLPGERAATTSRILHQ